MTDADRVAGIIAAPFIPLVIWCLAAYAALPPPRPPVAPIAYCPTDMPGGVPFVPCRDADRIRSTQWDA